MYYESFLAKPNLSKYDDYIKNNYTYDDFTYKEKGEKKLSPEDIDRRIQKLNKVHKYTLEHFPYFTWDRLDIKKSGIKRILDYQDKLDPSIYLSNELQKKMFRIFFTEEEEYTREYRRRKLSELPQTPSITGERNTEYRNAMVGDNNRMTDEDFELFKKWHDEGKKGVCYLNGSSYEVPESLDDFYSYPAGSMHFRVDELEVF